MVLLCLVVGCAAGAEMRPRGKRNSLRIEVLEKRIAGVEGRLGIGAPQPPADGAKPIDPGSLAARVEAIDERLSILFQQQQRIEKQLTEMRAATATAPAPSP